MAVYSAIRFKGQPWIGLPADGRVQRVRVIGFEFLARFYDGKQELNTQDVITHMEDVGSVALFDLGYTASRYACKWAKRFRAQFERDVVVSVNISPLQIQNDPDFPDRIEDIIMRSGIARDSFCIELTERELPLTDAFIDGLIRLNGLGIKIALDDFGISHTMQRILRHSTLVHTLKIDRKLVSIDAVSSAIILALLAFAKALPRPLNVVIEGVETEEMRVFLEDRLWGTDTVMTAMQGYLFGRPMWPKDLHPWARSNGFQ
jgi:EAL domain-containing protein (putative c-di-GMP-specific phosphodiesterase class I)